MLDGFGYLSLEQGDPSRALRLAGAAATVRMTAPDPGHEAQYWLDRWLPRARAAMSQRAAAAAWVEGELMSLDEAVANTRASDNQRTPSRGGATHHSPLTAREREVVQLIAEGRTDRQIAEALVISQRTAHAHVHNVLGKLGMDSRVQVAAWAIHTGLVSPEQR